MTAIPEGWKIERRENDPLLQSIAITAPNGYSAIVSCLDRNPVNILYMLAEALLNDKGGRSCLITD